MRCIGSLLNFTNQIAVRRIDPELVQSTAMPKHPLPHAPQHCWPDRPTGFEDPRIADRQLHAEVRAKCMDVRRIVIKWEHHDANAIDLRDGRHTPYCTSCTMSPSGVRPWARYWPIFSNSGRSEQR